MIPSWIYKYLVNVLYHSGNTWFGLDSRLHATSLRGRIVLESFSADSMDCEGSTALANVSFGAANNLRWMRTSRISQTILSRNMSSSMSPNSQWVDSERSCATRMLLIHRVLELENWTFSVQRRMHDGVGAKCSLVLSSKALYSISLGFWGTTRLLINLYPAAPH